MSTADLFGTDSESEDDEFDPGPVNEEVGSEGETPRFSSGGESSDEDGNQEMEATNDRPVNQQQIEEDDENNSPSGQEDHGDDDEDAEERSYQSPKRDALLNEADQSDAEEDETPSKVSQERGSYSESNDDENDEGSTHKEKKEVFPVCVSLPYGSKM